jgi:hypothetical protein
MCMYAGSKCGVRHALSCSVLIAIWFRVVKEPVSSDDLQTHQASYNKPLGVVKLAEKFPICLVCHGVFRAVFYALLVFNALATELNPICN